MYILSDDLYQNIHLRVSGKTGSTVTHTVCFLYHKQKLARTILILYTNIDQKLVNLLHGLLNCEIGGLDSHVITTEYRTRVQCIHM